MAGVGEVLGEGSGVLLVVDGDSAAQLAHHVEDVDVGVDYGDEAGAQHQDGQGGRVGGHVAPVQHADVRLLVEEGLVEPQQRGAAQHGGGYPREGHPTLTPETIITKIIRYCLLYSSSIATIFK